MFITHLGLYACFYVYIVKSSHLQWDTEKNDSGLSIERKCDTNSQKKCGPCKCFIDLELSGKSYCDCQHVKPKRDCRAFYDSGWRIDGIYKVTFGGDRLTSVYCDQNVDGGGWTVIQRRMDGTTNFHRSWNEYKKGFGKLHLEFWLGNEAIHLLTKQAVYPKNSELFVKMNILNNDLYTYVNRYSHFQVDNEKEKYRLHLSGVIDDDLYASKVISYHSNKKFSTFDQDNDDNENSNCAKVSSGGWWYNNAHCENYCDLNGKYPTHKKETWQTRFHYDEYKMSNSELKVRRNV